MNGLCSVLCRQSALPARPIDRGLVGPSIAWVEDGFIVQGSARQASLPELLVAREVGEKRSSGKIVAKIGLLSAL